MQHIFNVAIEFEDEYIQNMIYAKAEKEVIKKVIQDVENAIYEPDQFFTDNKDAIIKETSKILADRLSRTKAAKELNDMGEWTKVEDKLPNEAGYYITFHRWRTQTTKTGEFHFRTDFAIRWYDEVSEFGDETVVAWMKIPEPPKEQI